MSLPARTAPTPTPPELTRICERVVANRRQTKGECEKERRTNGKQAQNEDTKRNNIIKAKRRGRGGGRGPGSGQQGYSVLQ